MLGRLLQSPRFVAATLVLGGYVAVSQVVLQLFPFSVFDMYASHTSSGSRIGARTAAGDVVEVTSFTQWACEGPIDPSPRQCGPHHDFYYIPYKDDELVGHVRTHAVSAPAARAESVDLVRRIFWLDDEPGAPYRVEDCVLAHCRAVREP